jgi:TM2 domain-containing membrane protein YozV
MSDNALVKAEPNNTRGVVAGVAGFLIPGLGQWMNGETDKAIGMGAVFVVTGIGLLAGLPLLGGVVAIAHAGMHVVGGIDGYIQGRKKR